MTRRNTVQRMLVLQAVQALHNHPSADEIYDEVIKECPTISKGTVYRNLNQLADEGEILRVLIANAPDRFDRTKEAHCHFRCLACGAVFDCFLKNPIEFDYSLTPGFTVTEYEFVLNGFCNNCKGA